jgi:alpha-galactosidase/6-phospho-beta-glucosidase family protein
MVIGAMFRKGVFPFLFGTFLFGGAYYYVKDDLESQRNDLLEKTKSIQNIKTERQLKEEYERQKQKQYAKLLEKREEARKLPEEKENEIEKQLIYQLYNKWNSIFYGISEELGATKQRKDEELLKSMTSRLHQEIQSKYHVKEGEYKIKELIKE